MLAAAFVILEFEHAGVTVQFGFLVGRDDLAIGRGDEVLAGAANQAKGAEEDQVPEFHDDAPHRGN
ncbi:hypothetical protein D3C84_1302760 [compost metagenome]